MNDKEETLTIILTEIGEIKKELKRIANYLEVIAKFYKAELLFKYGKEVEIKEDK